MKRDDAILRRWVGTIRTADREEYIRYIEATGVADYLRTPGNLGCQMLMRDREDGGSEVTTLSWWESIEAIRGFAGADVDLARYYPDDDRFLLDRCERVEHHVIVVDGLSRR